MKKCELTYPGIPRVKQKLLLKMKLTLLIFAIGLAQASASVYSQSTKLTYDFRNKKVSEILMAIEETTAFRFFYQREQIDVDRRVSLQVNDKNVEQLLASLFENEGVSYRVMDDNLILLTANKSLAGQQPQSVKGRVTNEKGEPVPGATVVIKGTGNGTITDSNGNYTLGNVPGDATLIISFVGMKSQEVAVAGQTAINVSLQEETIGLEEVVAVGYGVQRRSDLAGSVGIANAEDILKTSSFSALQGMKGKVSGVNIFTNSGNPTGGSRVIIRGINSINTSTDPLYVVDGVQMSDFQYINPNDIERIEVLKDASAAAIYGARGANGVILVTTKRGKGAGEGVTMSYDGWVSVGVLARKVDVMNSDEFMEMEEKGFANFSKYDASKKYAGMEVDRSDPLLFDSNGNPLYNTDWQDEVTRTAVSHSHQLSIQQQGKTSSVGAFLNYTDQQGIMLNNYMKRVNVKMTYDADPKKWLSTSLNMMVNHTWANDLDETGGGQTARRTMLEMPPIFPVKFPDGKWSSSQFEGNHLNLGLEAMSNPVHELKTRQMNRFRTKLFGNAALTFHILEGFDLKTQIGVDANLKKDKNFSPNDLINISSPLGRANIYSNEDYYWQEETYLTYNKNLDKHRINAVAGLSWSKYTFSDDNTGDVSGFSTNYFGYNNLGSGTTPSAPSSGWRRWSMNSYYLRGSYTYNDKYLATVTARVDGSSRFGKNNQYAFFPSAALGWIISREDFLNDAAWLNNLKLHASYGRTGSTEIDPYSTTATITSGTVLQNGTRAASAYIAQLANPNLKWEKTDQFDAGINLTAFNNRVNLELDYYYKLTSDLLLFRPVPYTTGFGTVVDNIGEVSNRGLDILLNTSNVQTDNFSWETTINVNFNKNKIEKLGENNEDIITDPGFVGGNVILRVGESLGSYYGYRRLGVWGTDEVAEAAAVGAVPGEAKRTAEREIIGKGLPDWTGSFINTFNYKNWDMTVDLQFVFGVDSWQLFFHSLEDRSGIANGLKTILYDGWTEDNQNTMIQQIRQQNYSGQNSNADSHWVSDGSYVRGNLIQLGYTFDNALMQSWGFKRLRAYFSVNNAFVIDSKDFKGYDPEAVSNNAQFGQNIFFFQYPKPRTFTFGVNLSF
jgi:TonB-linked SusC/RagA family outer membrane protein